MKRFFVTGTDTGVGKTHVTCALARRARQQGRRVFAFKPIETGCVETNGVLVGADQEATANAAGNWQRGVLRGLYSFKRPLAPFVASDQLIDCDLIVETVASQSDVDLVLVEGAGGWRVPITREVDMSALAKRLDLPVLIVARAGLGTINHSLLTVEAVERDGCVVAGVILSQLPEDDAWLARSNQQEIQRRCESPVILLDRDEQVLDRFT